MAEGPEIDVPDSVQVGVDTDNQVPIRQIPLQAFTRFRESKSCVRMDLRQIENAEPRIVAWRGSHKIQRFRSRYSRLKRSQELACLTWLSLRPAKIESKDEKPDKGDTKNSYCTSRFHRPIGYGWAIVRSTDHRGE